MSKLIYGVITHRNENTWTNNVRYTVNSNVHFVTPKGSMCDRALDAHKDRPGFIVVNDNNYVEDFYAHGYSDEVVKAQKQQAKAVERAAVQMTRAYQALTRNDMQIVAGAVGTALGGVTAIGGTVTVLTSIFTGDFSGTLGGTAAAILGGTIAYISYENMTSAMQKAYDCSKQFQKALDNYHSIVQSFAPEHMKDVPMYEPEFKSISKILRGVFPNWGEENLMYNKPSWAVA